MYNLNPKAQHILRSGGTIEIDCVNYVIDGNGIVDVGDTYIADRNNEPKLLVAKTLGDRGWIVPTTLDTCYDEHECCKVRKAEDYDI